MLIYVNSVEVVVVVVMVVSEELIQKAERLLSGLLHLLQQTQSRRFNEMYEAYVVAPGDIFREIVSVSEECFESF